MTELESKGGSQGMVLHGNTRIAFTSWGHGPAVVLLCCQEAAPGFIAALVGRFRVIEPHLPAPASEAELAHWFSVLVDGLGLTQPAAVLVGRFAAFAGAARNESERFGQVAVLPTVPRADQLAMLIERLSRPV